MKIIIDTTSKTLSYFLDKNEITIDLYTNEAFKIISEQWLKVGWNQKYGYNFSWLGVPIIQLPEDMVRIQEVIYQIKPDIIIECGVAHGGSLIYYASILKAMGKTESRIVGIDIEIRPHNRQAIEAHELFPFITLVEGSSIDPVIVSQVKKLVNPLDKVLVILDSCHTKQHVAQELEAYYDLVTPGSYIIATDGIMKDLYDVPRGTPEWQWDHPTAAAAEFVANHPEFVLKQPEWLFNESELTENITHWPGAWLQRK